MFNYKRLAFIFLFTTVLLIITDTQAEHQARRGLLSLVDIAVEESSQVSETAPSSFLDTLETGRINLYNFLNKENTQLGEKVDKSKGVIFVFLSIAYYIILLAKFICNYVITFYPFTILILYLFLTSSIFKKDDFGPSF